MDILAQELIKLRTHSLLCNDVEIEENENDRFDNELISITQSKKKNNTIETDVINKRSSITIEGLNEIRKNRIRLRWKLAVKKSKSLGDPWTEFHIVKYPVEKVIRHRYNAMQQKWIKDECVVKMETEPFAFGAMRACYRVKKLSNFAHETSWEHASNYVAKSFMTDDVLRERYFDDVKLQMDAKLWAERYNKHKPPKKIDMFQISILEFINRPNLPLYHFEHFIDGSYVKYNSNSGFVCDDVIRHTPQAFSHFTFESSNHELIVVDIQGVGDLYTDPQIHTIIGTDYGDGNLGTKGMALFFKSHVCNEICEYLSLTPFDLAVSENRKNEKYKKLMKKRTSFAFGNELENLPLSAASRVRNPLFEIRNRFDTQTSNCSEDLNNNNNNNNNIIHELHEESDGYESSASPIIQSPSSCLQSPNASMSKNLVKQGPPVFRAQSQRTESGFFNSPCSPGDENFINQKVLSNRRSSCVAVEQSKIEKNEMPQKESILGQVHFELCKYHEMGRFVTDNEEIDFDAAFFHLKQAAKLGIIDAIITTAKIYLDLPHDLLENYKVPDDDKNTRKGFNFMFKAADKGDKNAIVFVAKAYDTGYNLPKDEEKNWKEAIRLYNKIIENVDDDKILEDMTYSDNSDEPIYLHLARMAEIYQNGGYGIEKNQPLAKNLFNQAAEKAMLYGKGRISNKYYMLAEAIPDEEEAE